MRDGEIVETSMGGDNLQLGSKLELRHNGGLCVRACVCVCVCVCVCLGPFQTATMAVCTQVPNRSWGWGAVLSRQRLCHVSAAGKTAQLTLSTVWALPKDSEFMQVETSLGTDGGSSSSTLSTQIHI